MSNETAVEHYTPREFIRLMVRLMFAEHKDELKGKGIIRTVFDPACGTVGRLIGCSPAWMILGSAAALAAWDLVFLDSALGNHSSGEPTRRYESRHLQSLLMALGFALLAIVLGRFVTIQLPFTVLLFSLAFILFALNRVWGYLKKRPM